MADAISAHTVVFAANTAHLRLHGELAPRGALCYRLYQSLIEKRAMFSFFRD
jgi:hypothetical protein